MRLLVIGGDSLIGGHLGCFARDRGIKVVSTSRNTPSKNLYLDLKKQDSFECLAGQDFDVVAICAGITDVSLCEKDKDLAYRVNLLGTVNLIDRLKRSGTHIVWFSSTHVWQTDERPTQKNPPFKPKNYYGELKSNVDSYLIESATNFSIVRFSKLADSLIGLCRGWQSELDKFGRISAFDDHFIAPLTLPFLLEKLFMVVCGKISGTHHFTGAKNISYFELANKIWQDREIVPVSAMGQNVQPDRFGSLYVEPADKLDSKQELTDVVQYMHKKLDIN